jgi:hypothetical protein
MSVDPVTSGLNLGTELVKLVGSVLRFFPDYGQKKAEEFHYHHRRYEEEIVKDFKFRDDNRVDFHRDRMIMLLRDFGAYIEMKQKESGK